MRTPFIIAEIGINASGSIIEAKKLIRMAKECDCDAVKFQKRTIEVCYTKEYLNSPRESPWGKTQRAQKYGLEFKREDYDEIDRYCKELGIEWFASAWDETSRVFLSHYNLSYNKIASPMLTNESFLHQVAFEKKLTFISTGMSTYDDIDNAVRIFDTAGCKYILMHTVSKYPCEDEECNIKMVRTLRRKYDCDVGYSGHEVGLLPSVLAVALGAVAVERHITLNRAGYGTDQAASIERRGLELLVRDCRLAGSIMGDGIKKILSEEEVNAKKMRWWK